jgi:hypothetical protein
LPPEIVRHRLLSLIWPALAGCLLAACGGSTRQPHSLSTHRAGHSLTSPAPARIGRGPGTGATQTVHTGSGTLRVRLLRVLDPLHDSGANLLPGERAIGVDVAIHNLGPAIYDSSSTTDVSLVDSDGPAEAVFVARGPCATALQNWDNYMYAGVARSGCVAFQVPARAALVAVRFSPHGSSAQGVRWSVAGR